MQRVTDLWRQLNEQRALVDREQELAAIHRETAEHEREAVMQVNRQLLTQIKALRKAQERVIELSGWEAQVDPSSKTHLHPPVLTDLRFN